ncbi:MAG: response regulator, partial [Verrucomicrobia bacterium]|nr:response regulator [Verrucomicrobiota bacterium]
MEKAVPAFSHFSKHPVLMMNHSKRVSIPRVYIVEDHPLFSTVLSEILKESGEFDVVGSTTDGAVANEFIRDNTVELLLVDMMLPGLTGMEILANLRDLQKPTKAVVLSGLGSD